MPWFIFESMVLSVMEHYAVRAWFLRTWIVDTVFYLLMRDKMSVYVNAELWSEETV